MAIAANHGGFRAAGTSGYDASADYVAAQLAGMGYPVAHVPFSTFFDEERSSLFGRSACDRSQPRLTLRFGFTGAEEFGTFGSAAYVQSLSTAERDRVLAYVNLDMVESTNAARYV